MAAFGSYETVEEIPSRPWVFVATVRAEGETGAPRLVLKATRSISGLDTPADAERRRRALLASAAVQDKVSQHKASRRWARIRDTSSSASETFVVMDRFDRSAADLGKQRRLTKSELRTLSLAVLEGLEEIESVCGRGHGRLSAANVLLGSKRGSVLGEIVLSDPAPEVLDQGEVDLRDFGFLLRHLATGFEDRAGEPLESAWAHLGDAAAFWRGLSNELIRLEGSPGEVDLAGLRTRIVQEAPSERRWKVPVIAGALVVVCAGIVAWGVFGMPTKVQIAELADEWKYISLEGDGWGIELGRALPSEDDISRRYAEESSLREHVANRLREIDAFWEVFWDSIPEDSSGKRRWDQLTWGNRNALVNLEDTQRPWGFLKPKKFQSGVLETHRTLMAFRDKLSDHHEEGEGFERWGLHTNFENLKAAFSGETWVGVGRLIDRTVASVSPESYLQEKESDAEEVRYQADAAKKLAGAIVDAAEVEYRLSRLAAAWAEAEGVVAELELKAGGDPVLSRAGELLESVTADLPNTSEGWEINTVIEVAGKVESVLVPLRLAQVRVQDGVWEKTEKELLRREAEGLLQREGMSGDTLNSWAVLAAEHERLDGESPVAGLLTRLRNEQDWLNDNIRGVAADDGAVVELRSDIDALRSTLDQQDTAWIKKHKTGIEAAFKAHEPEVDAIVDRVGAFKVTAAEMLTILESAENPADEPLPLRAYRLLQQEEWIGGLENQSLKAFQVKLSHEQLRGSLDEIAAVVPALAVPTIPAGFGEETISQAVADERISAIQMALDTVSQDWVLGAFVVTAQDRAELDDIAESRAQWLNDTERMLTDLSSAYTRLMAYEPLAGSVADMGGPKQLVKKWVDTPVYQDLGGDASFGSLPALVESLEAVERADRQTLVGIVAQYADQSQVAYAAWRRLGSIDEPWPRTAGELVAAKGYIDSMAAVFGGNPALGAYGGELRAEAAQRWVGSVRAMMAAADWDGMEQAFDMATSFDVDMGSLPDAVRLNAALYALKQAAGDGDDEAAKAGIQAYTAAVSGVEHIAKDGFARELLEFESQATDGTNVEALKDAGPGGHGWNAELSSGDVDDRRGVVLFFRTTEGLELEFRLIEESTNPDRLVYLSTEEVSIGVAAWAFQRAGGMSALGSDWSMLTSTQWQGPRIWKAQGGALVAIPRSEEWFSWETLAQDVGQKFAQGIQIGEPATAQFPIQHISFAAANALAASLGCRLPTQEEWVRAAESAVGGGDNLRDTSFGLQRDYVVEIDKRLPFPDAGIYQPDNTAVGREAVDGSRPAGTLYFEAVGSGGGFEHMYGNVAEWVSVGGVPGVIGGSALSNPGENLTNPGLVGGRKQLRERQSFSDVGFRLALEIAGTLKPSLAKLIEEWFESPRYVTVAE